jgi:hypothetical protein
MAGNLGNCKLFLCVILRILAQLQIKYSELNDIICFKMLAALNSIVNLGVLMLFPLTEHQS